MIRTLLLILCINFFISSSAQGITLLFKGGGTQTWNDPVNWIQINTPVGQTPIQRVPTELDDVVFSKSQSGLSAIGINFSGPQDSIEVGGNNAFGYRCKSIHVSNTDLSIDDGGSPDIVRIIVYTENGGHVIIDSGSNFRYGHLELHGGDAEINDLEVTNSIFGSLFSMNAWSSISSGPNGRSRFISSTIGGYLLIPQFEGELYADNCRFLTTIFELTNYSSATILNSSIENDINLNGLIFHVGKNVTFISSNDSLTSFSYLDFYTSGSVFNGNVTILLESSGGGIFKQEDPSNPLPNIINGNLNFNISEMGISGDLKISGDVINRAVEQFIYPDTAHVIINSWEIFKIGGISNYANNVKLLNCTDEYCHFNLEFFGNTNSNIQWPVGFPIDTLIVNKTGCAKVTSTNSLYASGATLIKNGQLVLDPNESIPYKFVCAGDLNILQGGGIFMRKNAAGTVANIAVGGAITDGNLVADSNCTGLSNPYNGDITLYRENQNAGNQLINISTTSSIGNISLVGMSGSDFLLGSDLSVNNFNFINPGKLLLGDHNLIINGNISNYSPSNFFVTNGSGSVQINQIGSIGRIFPVGPSVSSYNPATLTNFGTVDNFLVNVRPGVLSAGTTGNPYISGVVNRTWNIEESIPGASNISLSLQWNAEDELIGFNRSTTYLSHYTSGYWNNLVLQSATGTNPYFVSGTNITSLSPFAVMGPAAVVPVSLLEFNGHYQNKTIVLNWTTEADLNAKHFTIEKGSDAHIFRALTTIPALAGSQSKKNYHYIDSAHNGINYYRLKMVGFDGNYSYSKIIAVTTPTQHFTIYPNPVKDKLYISVPNSSMASMISIVDMKGTTIKSLPMIEGEFYTIIRTDNLSSGVYYIIFTSGFLRESLKFIKQ